MERLADWLIARRHWVFGVVLLVSTALGIAALRLSLDFRSADLLPQGHPFIEVQNRYHKNFGETNVLTVMLEAREGMIFTAPVLATLFRLTEAVDRLPGVNHDQVSSLAHRMTRWVRVVPNGGMVSDVVMNGPLALANAVVNAYMAARGIGLDLDTVPVIAVGVGFGIDYGIYILSRIQEGLRDGVALDEAVRDAIHLSGRTVAFTALTMTARVLCFTPTALRFVGEMATLLALWMVASSATALTLLPALIVVIRPGFLARSVAG